MNPSMSQAAKELVTTPSVLARVRKACAQVNYKGYACASLKSRPLAIDMVTMFFETGQFVSPAAAVKSIVNLEPIIEDAVHDAYRLPEMRRFLSEITEDLGAKFPQMTDRAIRREVKRHLSGIIERELTKADRSMPLDVLAGIDVVVAHVPGLTGVESLKTLKAGYFDDFRDATSIIPDNALQHLLTIANVSSEEYINAVEELRGERLDDGESVDPAIASAWSKFDVGSDPERPQLVDPYELVNAIDAAPNGFVPMVAFAVDAAYLCRSWRSRSHSLEGGVLALHDFDTGTGCPVRFEGVVDLSQSPGSLVQAEGVPCDFRESYGYSEEEFQSVAAAPTPEKTPKFG